MEVSKVLVYPLLSYILTALGVTYVKYWTGNALLVRRIGGVPLVKLQGKCVFSIALSTIVAPPRKFHGVFSVDEKKLFGKILSNLITGPN